LGIAVVPVYVRFEEKVYRDGITISHNELYQRLVASPIYPTTSQPPPADFADVYRKLAKETDEIVSIHVTNRLSGIYSSALQGRELVGSGCRIEVEDSLSLSVGLRLIVMTTARLAKTGGYLRRITEEIGQVIS